MEQVEVFLIQNDGQTTVPARVRAGRTPAFLVGLQVPFRRRILLCHPVNDDVTGWAAVPGWASGDGCDLWWMLELLKPLGVHGGGKRVTLGVGDDFFPIRVDRPIQDL